jgi:hypothetical protein
MEPVSPQEEQELVKIFTDIRVIQYSCDHVGVRDHFVPRKCKGYTLKELQDRQRYMFPRMRELSKRMPDEQLERVKQKAETQASYEIELTADAFSFAPNGCANQ